MGPMGGPMGPMGGPMGLGPDPYAMGPMETYFLMIHLYMTTIMTK